MKHKLLSLLLCLTLAVGLLSGAALSVRAEEPADCVHTPGEDGSCALCGSVLAASVSVEGAVSYFTDVQSALLLALDAAAPITVTLLQDVTLPGEYGLFAVGATILDLNGHHIIADSVALTAISLTVTDSSADASGSVTGGQTGIVADSLVLDGDFTVTGGLMAVSVSVELTVIGCPALKLSGMDGIVLSHIAYLGGVLDLSRCGSCSDWTICNLSDSELPISAITLPAGFVPHNGSGSVITDSLPADETLTLRFAPTVTGSTVNIPEELANDLIIVAAAYCSSGQMTDMEIVENRTITIEGDDVRVFLLNQDHLPIHPAIPVE